MSLFLLILCILILLFNCVLVFLPFKYKKKKLVKYCSWCVAIVILLSGSYKTVNSYCSRSFAQVASDGTITRRRNFPWSIKKEPTLEEKAVYILSKRSDGTEFSITPHRSVPDPNVRECYDGMLIEFNCYADELSGFLIEYKLR